MNRLSRERQVHVVKCLVEGNSIRATVRLTGVAKDTILKLLIDLGTACSAYQDEALRNLPCRLIQCDEIWAFCHAKAKNVPLAHKGEYGYGDVWTWVAIDADTKLVPSWLVGERNANDAIAFTNDLKSRLANRVQVSTDGLRLYVEAMEDAFGADVDFAQIVKVYGPAIPPIGDKRYSPAPCIGTKAQRRTGAPVMPEVSTSYVERQNLTMRMGMRRFTRLTNAFSKKVKNLEHAVALHFMYYNFCRPHQSLKNPYPRTPAMAAGVANHVWTVAEVLDLLTSKVI